MTDIWGLQIGGFEGDHRELHKIVTVFDIERREGAFYLG